MLSYIGTGKAVLFMFRNGQVKRGKNAMADRLIRIDEQLLNKIRESHLEWQGLGWKALVDVALRRLLIMEATKE